MFNKYSLYKFISQNNILYSVIDKNIYHSSMNTGKFPSEKIKLDTVLRVFHNVSSAEFYGLDFISFLTLMK